ncbi:hypothetical protein MalM25_06770 [Planctomycetes bacterium MalM25]|nr:hypothetical protein MalM25_06770 [Planctomycetes bacterium MalM25]
MSADFEPPWVNDPVAEVSFDCLAEDGSSVAVSVKVHRPRRKSADDPYACGVESRGLSLHQKLTPGGVSTYNIYGNDSWQALSLAIQFANSGMVHASEKGVVFQWEGETLKMGTLFPWNTAALQQDKQ